MDTKVFPFAKLFSYFPMLLPKIIFRKLFVSYNCLHSCTLWLFDLDNNIENDSFPVYYKSHYIKFRNKCSTKLKERERNIS